jgi:thioredoxin 1
LRLHCIVERTKASIIVQGKCGTLGGSGEFAEGDDSMAGQFVTEVNDADFEKLVLQSETPVLVDFWAAWCGPCRALAPVVDTVAEEYNGKLKVMKMDVDRNNMTPGRYGIRGIPALLVFKGGKVAEQIVGYVPKEQIDQTLKRVLV